jgi:hypothetical protein
MGKQKGGSQPIRRRRKQQGGFGGLFNLPAMIGSLFSPKKAKAPPRRRPPPRRRRPPPNYYYQPRYRPPPHPIIDYRKPGHPLDDDPLRYDEPLFKKVGSYQILLITDLMNKP